jgi:hypothetical protein
VNALLNEFTCKWWFATIAPTLFVLGACASSHYTVLQPASEPLTNFSVLQINDFTSNLDDVDSVNLANRFADQLHLKIMAEREKSPGQSFFSEIVRSTDKVDSVLVLDGKVISFDKGSRAKRYWIGFGAGKAYCTIQATFTNKETGAEVLKTNFDGELAMGFFGGDEQEAVDAVVESFIDYFADYFQVKTGP